MGQKLLPSDSSATVLAGRAKPMFWLDCVRRANLFHLDPRCSISYTYVRTYYRYAAVVVGTRTIVRAEEMKKKVKIERRASRKKIVFLRLRGTNPATTAATTYAGRYVMRSYTADFRSCVCLSVCLSQGIHRTCLLRLQINTLWTEILSGRAISLYACSLRRRRLFHSSVVSMSSLSRS